MNDVVFSVAMIQSLSIHGKNRKSPGRTSSLLLSWLRSTSKVIRGTCG